MVDLDGVQANVDTVVEIYGDKSDAELLARAEELRASLEARPKPKPPVTLLILFGLFIIISAVYFSDQRAVVAQISYEGISALQDPIQTVSTQTEVIEKTVGSKQFFITAQADYRMTAKVKHIRHYSPNEDATAPIGPYDLALAWGQMADAQMDKYFSYAQTARAYFVDWKSNCPLTRDYILDHSANTHIIPANEQVLKGVQATKVEDTIYLEGHLVNVVAKIDGRDITWQSSLTRTDRGKSCEVFYVKKIMLGNEHFE
ncbi:MAG: hypothetical protein H7Y41_03045 [Hyphomonadaceae bacterium]|nr:hypothetical protein [Clostridia bacterium]